MSNLMEKCSIRQIILFLTTCDMALEIERKYLVADHSFRELACESIHIRQGYISRDADATIRVRIAGRRAFLTVKTKNKGCVRQEYEYEIPASDGADLLKLCKGPVISKIRHIVDYAGFKWEIDEFLDNLSGITVAEIELPTPETVFPLPPFAGKEVTGNPDYYNSNIHKLAER